MLASFSDIPCPPINRGLISAIRNTGKKPGFTAVSGIRQRIGNAAVVNPVLVKTSNSPKLKKMFFTASQPAITSNSLHKLLFHQLVL